MIGRTLPGAGLAHAEEETRRETETYSKTYWETYFRPDPLRALFEAQQSPEDQEAAAAVRREMAAKLATLYEQGGLDAFERASLLVGRNNGPALLRVWYHLGALTDADLPPVVADVWSSAEWPTQSLTVREWVRFFRLAAYPAPARPLTVYRGTTAGRRRGMSWTTDLEQARLFADAFVLMGRIAEVVSVIAPPEAVLAAMDEVEPEGRKEHEVVVDPGLLPPVRRLEVRPRQQ